MLDHGGGSNLVDSSTWPRRFARFAIESTRLEFCSHPEPRCARDFFKKRLNFYGGIFIEIFAGDGYKESCTYFLEKFFIWSGVLVEFDRELRRRISLNRKMGKLYPRVDKLPVDSLNKCAKEDIIESIWLDLKLDAVDLLVVNAAGRELELLEGAGLTKCRPSWILIRSSNLAELKGLLCERFRFEYFAALADDFFVFRS